MLQLAPDAASAKAGQGLAGVRHWVSLATEDQALWGECKGSGAKPYQVRVDLSEPAFKCSCPSRKFPCKHALGLMLLLAGGAVPAGARPDWVEQWLAERAERSHKQQEKREASPKAPDPEAQAKRKEDRLNRIAEGLTDLQRWLHDLVRTGIAALPQRGYGFFDEPARRLIDAQAPGVARRVRALGSIASSGAGWHNAFLQQLSLLHLLIRAFEQRDSLADLTREIVLNTLGIERARDTVLALPGLADHWQIIAQQITLEDRLRAQHTWLLGKRSGKIALVLAFAHGNQPFDSTLVPGFAFDGEICFYPGEELRALIKTRADFTILSHASPATDVEGLFTAYAEKRSLNPWIESVAALLGGVVPARSAGGWTLIDGNNQSLPIFATERDAWIMLALSGGKPLDVAILYDGQQGRPLTVVRGSEVVQLNRAAESLAS